MRSVGLYPRLDKNTSTFTKLKFKCNPSKKKHEVMTSDEDNGQTYDKTTTKS